MVPVMIVGALNATSLECSPIRGDGLIRGTEECDDRNVANGDNDDGMADTDGCSAEGLIATGWTCQVSRAIATSSEAMVSSGHRIVRRREFG